MLHRTPDARDAGERDIMSLHQAASPKSSDGEARSFQRTEAPSPPPERPEAEQRNATEGSAVKPSFASRVRQHWVAAALAILALVAVIVGAVSWYLESHHFETTDDAFIDGHSVAISPQVAGYIVDVPVTDNQGVHPGDLLAVIDQRDYVSAVQQAQALIEQGEAGVSSARAQIEAQKAQVNQSEKQIDEARAALNFSRDQDARAQDLVKKGAGTVQNAQQTASDLISKQAALAAAVAANIAAQRQIDVLQAQVKTGQAQVMQAQAQKTTAQANLSRTQLRATIDGRVTRLTAALGASAAQGQALMILVPTDLWVTANFKETQLADMRPGQPVDIEIDAYGKTLPGHVDSIQGGSGTAFSLLPAENATGNYVKIVQRVPVKLTFDKPPEIALGPGMSVVPRVRVR